MEGFAEFCSGGLRAGSRALVVQAGFDFPLRACAAVLEPTADSLRTESTDPTRVAMMRTTLTSDTLTGDPTDAPSFGVSVRRLNAILTDDSVTTLDYNPKTRKLGIVTGPYRYMHACYDQIPFMTATDRRTIWNSNSRDRPDAQLAHAAERFDDVTHHARMSYDPDHRELSIEAEERNRNDVGTDDGCYAWPLHAPGKRELCRHRILFVSIKEKIKYATPCLPRDSRCHRPRRVLRR